MGRSCEARAAAAGGRARAALARARVGPAYGQYGGHGVRLCRATGLHLGDAYVGVAVLAFAVAGLAGLRGDAAAGLRGLKGAARARTKLAQGTTFQLQTHFTNCDHNAAGATQAENAYSHGAQSSAPRRLLVPLLLEPPLPFLLLLLPPVPPHHKQHQQQRTDHRRARGGHDSREHSVAVALP